MIRLFLTLLLVTPLQAQWPTFRGPNNDGILPPLKNGKTRGLPVEWSETKNVVWRTALPGRAWSTPVIMDDQIWLTNATPNGKKMYAVCLDKATGKEIHNRLLFENENPEPLGNKITDTDPAHPPSCRLRLHPLW